MKPGTAQPSQASVSEVPKNTGTPLAVVTTLFFMWGALTSLNDVLIPHFQHVFKLDLKFSMLVQTAFFASYFVFSLPSAKIIDWMGYHRAMVTGLLVMGLGAFLFVPAAKVPSFPLFLTALVVLAAGITLLQVAANPYVAVLGNPETASSRLNLTQAFNSLGTTIAPWVGGFFILSSAAVAMNQTPVEQAASVIKPYVGLGIALVLLAIVIASFQLPKIPSAEHRIGEKINDSIWKHPNLIYGAMGIFLYVGAEVAIGSSIANYLALDNIGHLASPGNFPDTALRYQEALRAAAKYISLYWGGAMVGRFIGSAVLQKVKTSSVMALCTIMAALLVTVSVMGTGAVAMWSILLVGFFNSIMFPSIFTMGIAELGPLTGKGSGVMIMAIVGGAIIPWIVGFIADSINARSYGGENWGQGIHYALIVPAFCYLYLLFFAVSGSKPNSERYAKS
jgi:FHS family L-fucose permease-like MFS transporter